MFRRLKTMNEDGEKCGVPLFTLGQHCIDHLYSPLPTLLIPHRECSQFESNCVIIPCLVISAVGFILSGTDIEY